MRCAAAQQRLLSLASATLACTFALAVQASWTLGTGAQKVSQILDAKIAGANRVRSTHDGKHVLVSSLRTGDVVVYDATARTEVKRLQWYPSPMQIDGESFPTAEHYMMWYEARLFGDDDSARNIMSDSSPAVAKALGRQQAREELSRIV